MIAEVNRLVKEEGVSKYAAAKRLKMKRSTLYGYLEGGDDG